MSPNVIVFLTDQQRWDTAGIHGNPLNLTPNLDRIARQGTDLHHTITPQPLCGPARACLQTGQYATEIGCHINDAPLPQDVPTLAQAFKNGGYRTSYIGKWHLAGQDPVPEELRGGYDDWLAANYLEFTSDAYHTTLYDETNAPVDLPGYRVDALTDAAIRYLHQQRSEPFLLFLSYLEPHHQNHLDDYPAPTGYREPYTGAWLPPDLAALGGSAHQHIAGYYGMVKRLDEALGRLLDALQSLGLLDDTILLFTSDHGNHFKTRNSEYKRSGHEASIRVPTVLTGPGFRGGGMVQQLVSLVDLPPTLLDAAGLPIPQTMSGRSVLPLLRGETEGWPDDAFIQTSEAEVGRAIRTARWKYGVIAPDADPWQDAHASLYEETYLYDLQADPYELRNLIGLESHRETAAVLRDRLLRRMAAVGEPTPEVHLAAPQPGGEQRRVTPQEARS